ncbi:MAG: PAS domain S-box protein [bacterium]
MSGSEERYTQIFNSISQAVFTLDLEGNIQEVNDALTNLTGYKQEDLRGKTFTEVVAGEYLGLIQLILRKTLDGKTISKGDMQIIKADKNRLWAEISTSALRDPEKKVVGQVCILRDISVQKSKEEEIKGSERFLSHLVDNGIDAVYVYDAKGKIDFFSKGGEKLLGWRSEEIMGQNFEMLIAPEALNKLKGQLSSRRADEHRTYQTVLVSKGGRRIDAVQKVIPISREKNSLETCSIVTNITAQQKLQGEITAMNEKLNGLIRLGKMISSRTNLEEILNFIVGSVTTFARVDIAVLRLLSDDKKQLMLRTCFGADKTVVPGVLNLEGSLTNKALEEARVISVGDVTEESALSKVECDVGQNVTSMLAVPLIARKEGKGILYLYTREYCQFTRQQIDLAFAFVNQAAIAIESAMLYNREQDTINKLRDLDQAKSDFLSMVSHELRSPLTSIKGYTSLILGGRVGEVNEKQRKFLEIVATQSNHLTKLISDLLDLSRIESGKLVLKQDKISLKGTTDLIAERFKLQFDAKNLTFNMNIGEGPLEVRGDEERILQVISNVMSNAIKFTPEGGSVSIKIYEENNNVEFHCTDTGIGLKKGTLENVFSEFYQADSSATRQVGGAGLGLAIVKKIVEAHGGKVWAESEGVNAGTTIALRMPAAKDEEKTAEGEEKS